MGMRAHGIQYGIADIIHLPIELPAKILLKGKNNEHAVDIGFQFPHSPLIPRPHLRRYVVKYFDALCSSVFGDASVKAAVVDKDHYVRLESFNVVLASANVL